MTTFTPVLVHKAGEDARTAGSPSELVELLWDGWTTGDPAPVFPSYTEQLDVLRDSISYVSVGGDETSALNAYFATPSPLGIKKLVGNFSVFGTIFTGTHYVDLSNATITQTANGAKTFELGAGGTLWFGKIVGKGTDYVASTNLFPTAIAVRIPSGANGAGVHYTRFENHAGAGIVCSAADFHSSGIRIRGLGSPTIPAGDAACFGVYLSTGSVRASFSDISIWDTSISMIGSTDTEYLSLRNVHVWDVWGQHGIYLQNGTGLNVDGVSAKNINMNGMKVQLASTSPSDSTGLAINNVVGNDCKDTVLSLNNIATDLTNAKKFRGVAISNVSGHGSYRVLYLASVRGCTLANIAASASTGDAITFLDCQDVVGNNLCSLGSGRLGIRFTTATGATSRNVKLNNVRIKDPAGNNVASNEYGIYVAGVTGVDWIDLTIDGLDIDSSNAFMDYGLFFANGDQETFTLRNARCFGATANDIRLASGPRKVKEWTNVKTGTAVLFFPMTALPIGGTGLANHYWSDVIPTSGTWKRGDIVFFNAPVASGFIGAVCVAAGTPGTWKNFGAISA